MYRAETQTAAPEGARPSRPRELSPGWLVALVALMLLAAGVRVGFALEPQRPQEPDSIGYARIAETLYEEERFSEGIRDPVQQASNYSPGLPLLVAGLYELTGGVHLELARVVLALIGSLAVLFTFLIGRRLAGPGAGFLAAIVVAGYPALLQFQGMLMTEPLAVTLLAGSLLAFLWAGDDERGAWGWAAPGLLLGLLTLVRPEYLPFGFLLAAVAAFRVHWLDREWSPGLAAAVVMVLAFLLPIAPWTVRNANALDRFVPVSTGGGKALFIGTNIEADGDGPRVREQLLAANPGLQRRLAAVPLEERLDRALAVVAAQQHPGVPTDVALSRIGRDNLDRSLSDDPAGFAAMLGRKAYRAWREGPRPIMHTTAWKVAQKVLAVLALLGLAVLCFRRRWEAVPALLIVAGVTATAALLIASPRRVIVILPLVAALGATTLASLASLRRSAP